MLIYFVVAGTVWFALAGAMALALAAAARGFMPEPAHSIVSSQPDAALDDTADQRAILNATVPPVASDGREDNEHAVSKRPLPAPKPV